MQPNSSERPPLETLVLRVVSLSIKEVYWITDCLRCSRLDGIFSLVELIFAADLFLEGLDGTSGGPYLRRVYIS